MSSSRKFGRIDADFVKRRNDFFGSNPALDPMFIIEQWPLFVGFVPLGTLLARYELLKMIQNVPGHLLEFGCHQGAHLHFMAKVLQLLAPNDLRKIYGFDSLLGLTEFSEQDRHAMKEQGNYRGDLGIMKKMLELHDIEDRVEIVVGKIEETLPRFLRDNSHHIYSYVYLDTDLYQSTVSALDLCWPRLAPGGLIVLDEGYHDRFPGEGAALQEFLRKIPGAFECGHFPFTRQPMVWIKKK
ncbi:MAG: hypothetical protein A2V88_07095 [Elusimicrobia bacterium RBG_16_66_12]|nr:MAG: hypothetical protein A2V88_07095 [Elusimicrobia bacterium RBG_16_66_12]